MNEQLSIWYQALSSSFTTLLNQLASFLPSLVAAIFILVIGYFIAKALRKLIINVAKKIGVRKVGDGSGINELLAKIDKRATLTNLTASLVFWAVLLIFVVTAIEILGLPRLSSTVDTFILFIPKIFAAIVVLVFSLVIANIAKRTSYEAANNAQLDFARPLSQMIHLILVVLGVTIAIGELEIETQLLNNLVSIIALALGVAAAISLGLGSKSSSENILHSVYIKEYLAIGDSIVLDDGRKGVIETIGPVSTTLSNDSGTIIIENKDLIGGVTKVK